MEKIKKIMMKEEERERQLKELKE
jgi:hypothetical protein